VLGDLAFDDPIRGKVQLEALMFLHYVLYRTERGGSRRVELHKQICAGLKVLYYTLSFKSLTLLALQARGRYLVSLSHGGLVLEEMDEAASTICMQNNYTIGRTVQVKSHIGDFERRKHVLISEILPSATFLALNKIYGAVAEVHNNKGHLPHGATDDSRYVAHLRRVLRNPI